MFFRNPVKKPVIKVNRKRIYPKFELGESLTVKAEKFNEQTNKLVKQEVIRKVKKIRVVVEISNSASEKIESITQYLLVALDRENSDNLTEKETWVSEESLIL